MVFARVIRHRLECSFRRGFFTEGVHLLYNVGVQVLLGESRFLRPMFLDITNPYTLIYCSVVAMLPRGSLFYVYNSITEQDAIDLAEQVLYHNPKRIFNL